MAASIALVLVPAAAFANATPNSYSPSGSAWVDVPQQDRVYFDTDSGNITSGVDDASFFYVPSGVTCTDNSTTTVGPFISTDYQLSSCTEDSSSNPYAINYSNSTRDNAVPFGFSINFYGQTYSSAWPNSNGGINFGNPDINFNDTMPSLADSAQSSRMFALGSDQWFDTSDSAFWTAQTTVDGNNAVVFTWENFHNCCNDTSSGSYSYQIVLIDLGGGDFNAYFNYDKFEGNNEGYGASWFLLDLSNDVNLNNNIVHTNDASFAPSACSSVDSVNSYGTPTDSTYANDLGSAYFKLEDITSKTISLWSDSSCTTPLVPTVSQDVQNDGNAYLEFQSDVNYDSVTVGWSTYDTSNSAITWTELLRNIDASTLEPSGANPLVNQTLNSSVSGRFIIGQRGGQTVGAGGSGLTQSAPEPELAMTGLNSGLSILFGTIGFSGLILGLALVILQRKKISK